jgi:lysozyme family protein
MASRFPDALKIIFDHEGRTDDEIAGDVDTSWGVTQPVYDEWRRAKGLPTQDVDLGTEAEFRDIYLTLYWKRGKCDDITWPLALLHFDTAVNCGVGLANRMLQEALGVVVIDGIIGGATLKALKTADPNLIFCRYAMQRLAHYAGLARRSAFHAGNLRGWLRRVGSLLRRA